MPRRLLGSLSAAALAAASLSVAGIAGSGPPAAGREPAAPSGASSGITHADNPGVPEGASWTERYFPSARAGSPTPVTLHADVLRPEGLPAGAKTPVILSVGPYFNHAGQTGRETDTYQPTSRFDDLIEGGRLMERGYTFVAVDLRGFGASTGCLDWMGPGEQADVKAAVEWAASQPWSTGKVGMYGKSYDAVTGLWANDLKPKGLGAVVAQEPLWDMYPYLYSNEVPRPNQNLTPEAYNDIASLGATKGDSARYKRAAAYEKRYPQCLTRNLHDNISNTSPEQPYWQQRDQAAQARGTTTPLFVTQGFTESNTKPEEMERFLDNHVGPERGWLGPWEHVRGNERDPESGELAMGRQGWFREVMGFYDQYLKGAEPADPDPGYSIQDNVGDWREQASWPAEDSRRLVTLEPGRYIDSGPVDARGGRSDGRGLTPAQAEQVREHQIPTRVVERRSGDMDQLLRSSLGTPAERRATTLAQAGTVPSNYLTWSRSVRVDTRLTGTPRVVLNTRGEGEVHVTMWDVDPKQRSATLIDENVAKLTKSGRTLDLKSLDWTLRKGHRLVVGLGTIPGGYWYYNPSGRIVTVNAAHVELAVQSTADDVGTQGEKSLYLDSYIRANTVRSGPVPQGTFEVPTP